MKVKVGDTLYDSDNTPIVLILDPDDKINIANMIPQATKYGTFPESYSEEMITTYLSGIK